MLRALRVLRGEFPYLPLRDSPVRGGKNDRWPYQCITLPRPSSRFLNSILFALPIPQKPQSSQPKRFVLTHRFSGRAENPRTPKEPRRARLKRKSLNSDGHAFRVSSVVGGRGLARADLRRLLRKAKSAVLFRQLPPTNSRSRQGLPQSIAPADDSR